MTDPIEWEDSLPIRPSTPAWRAAVRALYGSPLAGDELELFRELAGGVAPPAGGASEFLAVVGRRGGKSETIARVGVFEALHGGHGAALAPGQVGVFAVVSPLREQSAEIMGYARGLASLPGVRGQLARPPAADAIEFRTGVSLQVMTCDGVAVVGKTLVGAVADEFARWPGSEATTPDAAILDSLRPGLAPVVGAPPRRFIGITSAFIREGVAYETERDHFGREDSPVLVVRGTSALFNPSLDAAWLERERLRVGERVFAREYLAEWQDAITDGYFADVLDGSIDRGRASGDTEPHDACAYWVAIDPAWSQDRWALAVCHREPVYGPNLELTGVVRTVVDLVETWQAPRGSALSTDATARQCAAIARSYGTTRILSDQAAVQPLTEAFARHGVYLEAIPWTATSKPTRFRQMHAAMADGHVRLPDDQPTIAEFASISTRMLRSGGEQIAARRGHDDRVSAVVLACTVAMDRDVDPDWHVGGVAGQPERTFHGPERFDPYGIGYRLPPAAPPGATNITASPHGVSFTLGGKRHTIFSN